MGKAKAVTSERRVSARLAGKPKPPAAEPKKKAAKRAAAKPKKAKPAENGSKVEEPKAEATETE